MARKTSFDVDPHSITLVKGRREGRKWKLPNEPKPTGSGRDGQIRTADLSLRRRPLYPSELRPRMILRHFCFAKYLAVSKLYHKVSPIRERITTRCTRLGLKLKDIRVVAPLDQHQPRRGRS